MSKKVDFEKLQDIGRQLLEAIGENPDREGLVDTPKRFAKMWREFIEYDPGNIETSFQSVTVDQMVVVSGMRVVSYCEHHMLPFICDISIGYLTGAKVLGLSKFARIAHKHAHKLQIQERLVNEIAEDLEKILETDNIAVVANGLHSCMIHRGVKTAGVMTSSIMRGSFRDNYEVRQEFFNIVNANTKRIEW